MASAGALTKILNKIKEAGTPENFNADFLSTKLGFKGGNSRTFISWAKKVKLLNEDGSPTLLYKKFRNPSTSAASMAEAIREGYAELYLRNEYCHELDKKAFKGLVMEATGGAHDSRKVEMIVATFFNAKEFADFDSNLSEEEVELPKESIQNLAISPASNSNKKVNLGLNYTINLVLPKTDDPSIYNAIFKSLRENLLSE
ncbi:DUF5343 domain-containing protein [Pontibacter pudoricolor]|uniref:DUF5343 domain-containing protein n=1 Tax=Pontibacter pudoricolor TaxID=2694930 RepID=UPI0013911CDE|nr:DUF5343 domain-containing protein [Pontibacter pudoricolor]